MTCSSLNRLRFIVRLLWSDGLYSILEEFSGLRYELLPALPAFELVWQELLCAETDGCSGTALPELSSLTSV
jgi:hypothetical protein